MWNEVVENKVSHGSRPVAVHARKAKPTPAPAEAKEAA